MHRSITRILAALTLAFSATLLLATACPVLLAAHAHGAQQLLTVQGLYHEVEVRLAGSGKIYKAVIRRTYLGGDIRQTEVTRVWADLRHDLSREQTTVWCCSGEQSRPYSYTTIYAGCTLYTRFSVRAPGQPAVQAQRLPSCGGSYSITSVIRGCAGAVQTGRYAGRQVLVLLCTGHQTGEGFARIYSTYTTRIYLDRQTLLPLADMTTGTSYSKPAHDSATYVTSLVAPSSLPANFFQPASIGYRGRADQIRQEMKPVPHGFAILWLGLDFAGAQGVPALSLQRADPMGGGTNFAIYLHYAPARNTGSDSLQFYEMSAGDGNQPQPPARPGYTRQTVKLANGHAVIVSGRDHMAIAYIGSTVTLVQPTAPALSSAQALRTIVEALRPYVPNP